MATMTPPTNATLIAYGDSRIDLGSGISGITGYARRLFLAAGPFAPLFALEPRLAMAEDYANTRGAGYQGNISGGAAGTVYLGNFGVSGQRTDNYIADPRPLLTTTGSEKSMKVAGDHPGAIVFVHGMINDAKGSGSAPGRLLDAPGNLGTLTDYLTNPANCGGVQKAVFLTDDTPIGKNYAGTVANSITAADVAAYLRSTAAPAVRAFDFTQVGGKNNCAVAQFYDVAHDDATSGAGDYNLAGWSFDGTHDGAASSLVRAKRILTQKMSAVLDAMGAPDLVTPRFASSSNTAYLNPNPLMTGTAGTVNTVQGMSLTGQLPSGWAMTWSSGYSAGLTLGVTVVSRTVNGSGQTELVLDLAWSSLPSGGARVYFSNELTGGEAALNAAGFVTGDRAIAIAKVKVNAGSVGFGVPGLQLLLSSTTNTNNFTGQMVGDNQLGPLAMGVLDAGGDWLFLRTPPCQSAQITASGAAWASKPLAIGLYFDLVGSSKGGGASGSARVTVIAPTAYRDSGLAITGTGGGAIPAPGASGSGVVPITGGGGGSVAMPVASGSGGPTPITGTGGGTIGAPVAFGYGEVTQPPITATGPIIAAAERTIRPLPVPTGGVSAAGLPNGSPGWAGPFDPADRAPYAIDWTGLLADGETIAQIDRIRVSAEAAAVGVEVDGSAGRTPIIATDGTATQFWFHCAPGFQENAVFAGAGVPVGISILIRTDATPYKQFERTGILTVRQQ